MNLKNFESKIEDKIVGRGLSYYKGGDVKRLEKVSENEFSAVVFGTEKYSLFNNSNRAQQFSVQYFFQNFRFLVA